MSAGTPWHVLPNGSLARELSPISDLSVFVGSDGRWRWEFYRNGRIAGTGDDSFDSLEQAREDADSWAYESSYPAVRVEVDQ